MNKHFYAYGHTIFFQSSSQNLSQNQIIIHKCNGISINDFTYKHSFENNQNRVIYLKTKENIELNGAPEEWIFVVEDVVVFLCNIKTQKICYKEGPKFSKTLLEYWLIHIVLPMHLTIQNKFYFLHTGSVVVDRKAVLFMGESYAGKSTLTDFFLKKGHSLVSDDKLATFYKDDSFHCFSSHKYHRPYRKMEDLGVEATKFYSGEVNIGNVYWLTPVKATQSVEIKHLSGVKKFERLRYSTEMDLYINKRKRFEYLGRLANSINMYEIQIPNDLNRLEEVYEKIIEHIQKTNKEF